MIDPAYVQTMARYNRWQNGNLYGAANMLSDDERRQNRSAFFKSSHATFNHLLWADNMWMSWLSGGVRPAGKISDSTSFVDDWEALIRERVACDDRIVAWAECLDAVALAGDLIWRSSTLDTEITRPHWLAVAHMFNHQAHHRGQAHAMLTAAGPKPQDTDLIMMQG